MRAPGPGIGLACAGALACSAPVKPQPPPAIHLVAAERDPAGGARLVVVDETGARAAELVQSAQTIAQDKSAAFSPDGAWIAFASTRGRDLDHTSIWVVAAKLDATPVKLTDDRGEDVTPAWTPDGGAIVFASSRGKDGVQLWRLAVAREPGLERLRAAGAPEELTHVDGAALSPSVAADGRIAFQSIAKGAGGAMTSVIALRANDGAITALTAGPVDATPAWSPDGAMIAFSAPIARAVPCPGGTTEPELDSDILVVDAKGDDRRVLLDVDDTSESGPVWSHDGRWIFATSLKRKAQCGQPDAGKPLLSSIVYAEVKAPKIVRMLREPAGPVSRFSIAVAPAALDDRALAAGPPYLETLDAILRHVLLNQP